MFWGIVFKINHSPQIIIPNHSFRLRIIANSNNVKDIQTKMQIKAALEQILSKTVNESQSLNTTEELVKQNLDIIDSTVASIMTPLNMRYQISFGTNDFPEKTYRGVVYPAGNYESLVIMLGDGEGDNWWCVLFPPLCFLTEDNSSSDVEYQLYISRILNYFK